MALIAPEVFDFVLEYPLTLVFAAALLPNRVRNLADSFSGDQDQSRRHLGRGTLWHKRDIVLAALILLVLIGGRFLTEWAKLPVPFIVYAGMLGAFAPLVLSRQARPLGFALCIAALLIADHKRWDDDETVWSGRSFFGVYRIVESEDPWTRRLVHGTTNHGGQWMRDDGSIEPTHYYTPASPVAAVIAATQATTDRQRTGLVGLGTGALAYYRRAGDTWRYFDIDPLIAWIAMESGYFDMLSTYDPPADIVLGDARLTLAREPDRSFDLLIIDAFSSDAIPVHLLTREAIGMYMHKLDHRGVLLLHISNRMLDLEPVVAGIVEELGHPALLGRFGGDTDIVGTSSHWVAIARDGETLEQLSLGEGWSALDPGSRRVWRDDFSNLAGRDPVAGEGRRLRDVDVAIPRTIA